MTKPQRKNSKSRKGKKVVQEIAKLESLKQINLNAAGLDIGASEIWACVPEDRCKESVRMYPTFTVDLHGLARWLEECGVETVAMESTGVHWIPIYEILEARGFKVYLVNARHVKDVTGKKSDILDCQWIQQLRTYGLLKASFRPEEEIATLRAYVRHRDSLIQHRSAHIQHMQKALHQMNVQLSPVIKDITGMTGMKIIRDIVKGERDPVVLARHRAPRCFSSESEIAKALTGNYREEHVFALRQALELYDFYSEQIRVCDVEIEKKYKSFEPVVEVKEKPLEEVKKKRRGGGKVPEFNLRQYLYQLCGVDLTRIDGLDVVTVQIIISEIGVDMSRWKSVKHFTSWLGLAPNNEKSGGKVIRSQTKKTTNRANQAFRLAARAVSRSRSALGGYYRRMKAKHGAGKANVATAHKIARMVYHMLKYREEYKDPGLERYEAQSRERAIKNLKRKAKELGVVIVVPGAASEVTGQTLAG